MQRRSNRNLWIAIIAFFAFSCVVGGVLLAILAGRAASALGRNLVVSDRERAAAIGHEIADYELPPGFYEQSASNLGYTKMVFISSPGDMTILLMQFFTTGATRDEMEQQMRASMAQQMGGTSIAWRPVADRTVTIHGQPTVVSAREGRTNYGTTMRQEIAVFDGKGGMVMLMVMGAKARWDAEALDQFLTSIK